MKAVNPAVSCKRNRPRLMNFPIIWDFLKTMYIYIHKLGTRLLSNPNKYGCEQLFLSTEYSKIGVVGAF